ncbi:MAG TPA: ribonuclease III [Acidisarcina sp.]
MSQIVQNGPGSEAEQLGRKIAPAVVSCREPDDLSRLETLLGHCFADGSLLTQAVTHSSLAYERAAGEIGFGRSAEGKTGKAVEDRDNEQLEFLGDAVVGLVVAEYLCKRYPDLQEGQLTRLRAALVSRRHLGEVAALLNLGDYLRLGRGEERSGGRKKNALLANCIEAVLGAVYLDGGLLPVRLFLERHVIDPYLAGLVLQMERDSTIDDHKSALQELLQSQGLRPPRYSLQAESGPDHRKRFVVEVRVAGGEHSGQAVASGTGPTKKKAEQDAARQALGMLRNRPPEAPGSAEYPKPAPAIGTTFMKDFQP